MKVRTSQQRECYVFPIVLFLKNIRFICSNVTDAELLEWYHVSLRYQINKRFARLNEIKPEIKYRQTNKKSTQGKSAQEETTNELMKKYSSKLFSLYQRIDTRVRQIEASYKNGNSIKADDIDSLQEDLLEAILASDNEESQKTMQRLFSDNRIYRNGKSKAKFFLKYVFTIHPKEYDKEYFFNPIIIENYKYAHIHINNSTIKAEEVIFDNIKENQKEVERYSTIGHYINNRNQECIPEDLINNLCRISGDSELDGEILENIADRLPNNAVLYTKYNEPDIVSTYSETSTAKLHMQAYDYLASSLFNDLIKNDKVKKELMKIIDNTGKELGYTDASIGGASRNVFIDRNDYRTKLLHNIKNNERLSKILMETIQQWPDEALEESECLI